MSFDDEKLKKICSDNDKLYRSLNTLGLFLKPENIEQKEKEIIVKITHIEKNPKTVDDLESLYRILMRYYLYTGSKDSLVKYAQKEKKLLKNEEYISIIKSPSVAIGKVKEYYKV